MTGMYFLEYDNIKLNNNMRIISYNKLIPFIIML